MPIHVTCACGKAYTFKDELAGRRVKCRECGQVIEIPAAPAEEAAETPVPEEAAAPEETKRRFSTATIAAFAVAGLAVVALAIIIPVFFLGGGSKKVAPVDTAAKPAAKTPAPSTEKAVKPAAPTPPAEKAAEPAAPTPPAEKAAEPATPTPPAEKAAETPAPTPAAEKEAAKTPAPPVAPKSRLPAPPKAFKPEPFDPAALKEGRYGGQRVCWKGQVLNIKSLSPGVLTVLVYGQGPVRVEATLNLRGNLVAGVGTGKTLVFEGTVDAPAADAPAQEASTLTIRNGRVDLTSLSDEAAPSETPAAPGGTAAPGETPASPDTPPAPAQPKTPEPPKETPAPAAKAP